MNRKHIAIPLLLALAANLTTAAAPDSERAASPTNPTTCITCTDPTTCTP